MENENTKKSFITAIVLNAICALMGIISCTMSFWNNNSGITCLKWYTVLSNLFAAATASLWLGFALYNLGKGVRAVPKWVQTLHYISTCCLFLTFVIVLFVLLPEDYSRNGKIAIYNKLFSVVNAWHHLTMPVLALVSVIFFEKKPKLSFKVTALAIIPTAVYAVVLMTMNAFRLIDGPYFFLRVHNQPWYISAMWVVVIMGIDYGLACALWALNKIRNS